MASTGTGLDEAKLNAFMERLVSWARGDISTLQRLGPDSPLQRLERAATIAFSKGVSDSMKAFLVRIAVDQAYGGWNGPVNPATREFVYVPIPDAATKKYSSGDLHTYDEMAAPLEVFRAKYGIKELALPTTLLNRTMHLDPDFDSLTYGDNGTRRGAGIAKLRADDLLVFYASLRSIVEPHDLVYALVGLFVVGDVIRAIDVPRQRQHENAHTRWKSINEDDVVVRGKLGLSGRFDRCIPIGQWRDNAYRLCRRFEDSWGGLTVKDGYIQRSAVPPAFLDADRFYQWFLKQRVTLMNTNNEAHVFIVHLRRPERKPTEMRSDPFWEFGSFGLTGCHCRNLMNARNEPILKGARLAFAQGGPKGTRLVYLTPPVQVSRHGTSLEACWAGDKHHRMPFKYGHAPILASRTKSNFPLLAASLSGGGRLTLAAQFSSNFRSRAAPLDSDLAAELIQTYTQIRRQARDSQLAHYYVDALPFSPACPDANRKRTFEQLRRGIRQPAQTCGRRKTKRSIRE